jgi:hypothetical protein
MVFSSFCSGSIAFLNTIPVSRNGQTTIRRQTRPFPKMMLNESVSSRCSLAVRPWNFILHRKPLMMQKLSSRMAEAEKKIREYLAAIGKRGGSASRRELTKSHARQMVAIREMKRAALKAGKPWPPRDRKLLKLR